MHRIPVILVCDDDFEDQLLIKDAFAVACIQADFRFTSDGLELIEYLQNSTGDAKYPHPDVILLDLNMPRMPGLEALEWIKSHPDYRVIPVVIYTTSHDESDIQQCYRVGANTFMTKCANFDDLLEKVNAFAKYWVDIAELPRVPDCMS
jgi:two-component system response regulator